MMRTGMRRDDMRRVEAAYRACHQRLWRALFVWSGNADLATEAEAEGFAQLCRGIRQIRDPEAWVWRASFRIAGGFLADNQTTTDRAIDAVTTIPEPAWELAEALSHLSELQRRCVVLRHVGGFSAEEIAALVDSTPGSVRVQIHRGLHNLRRLMEPQR
ncbi:MAG: RNA polymerase sigma factor [Actinomycetia bacterium]|nr:RNA polymerase sigma factor [Actinomycetes bacterium]MCP3912822.1 RNA polymerase sigma factor [Actinomycetes bacterium]